MPGKEKEDVREHNPRDRYRNRRRLSSEHNLAASEEGFFRLCFTCEAPGVMTQAVRRLIELLQSLRKP